jgi:serine protease Do
MVPDAKITRRRERKEASFLIIPILDFLRASVGGESVTPVNVSRWHPRARGALAVAAVLLTVRPAPALQQMPQSFADVVRMAKPTVVNISSTRTVRSRDLEGGPGEPPDEFFRHFFGQGAPPRSQQQRSLGSGFVLTSDGYIVTNTHVVEQAEQIRVKLGSGEEYDAKLIGADAKTDVALIKIKPRDSLAVARLGDSDKLEVGDWVLAIGNPFGLSETVTAGIVSAKARVIGAGPYDDFIQTDASINPGNSGGPLLNTEGEVVGINSAILSRSGGNVGIGFAIPVNLARHIVDELREHGKVTRGWLGVSIQDMTPTLAKSFGLDRVRGALVADVEPGSPADKAAIQRGDVITDFNGTQIEESHQLPALIANAPIGSRAEVTVLREGSERTRTVTIAQQPAERAARTGQPRTVRAWGLQLAELTPDLAQRFDVPPGIRGVIIRAVEPGSPADDAELQPGDIIRQVNRQTVTSVHACQQALDRAGNKVRLLVQRGLEVAYYALSRSE